jgi:hypothetical protein
VLDLARRAGRRLLVEADDSHVHGWAILGELPAEAGPDLVGLVDG